MFCLAQKDLHGLHILHSGNNLLLNQLTVALGPEIPASCIENRMKNLRAKAVAMGIMTSTPTSHAHAKVPATRKSQKKARKANEVDDDDDDDEDDEDEGFSDGTSNLSLSLMDKDSDKERKPDPFMKQHKTISGRIIKPRSSPRKNPRPNYKVLLDPFSALPADEVTDEENTSDKERSSIDKNANPHVGRHMNTTENNSKIKAEI